MQAAPRPKGIHGGVNASSSSVLKKEMCHIVVCVLTSPVTSPSVIMSLSRITIMFARCVVEKLNERRDGRT